MEPHVDAIVGIHADQSQPGIGSTHVRGNQSRAGSVPRHAHVGIQHSQAPVADDAPAPASIVSAMSTRHARTGVQIPIQGHTLAAPCARPR
ncbi:hypothetical protein GCM10010080_22010 [Thermomonas carbonis]|nr:hypothetical protein GCM10010080_22010 [Thermomonas carbonis]